MDIDTEKLKRWREERFWSQEHLAELAGVALRTVQRVENGGKASRETITALAAAFNVEASALTHGPYDMEYRERQNKLAQALRGLRLSFLIVLASWVFIMIVFAGISMSDGPGGHSMMIPAIWVTVATAGHGLAVAIIEIVARFSSNPEA